MTLEENIAFQKARIKGWSMIEEGWRVLRDCYPTDTYDYQNYDKEIRHPRVCREMAERELTLLERQTGEEDFDMSEKTKERLQIVRIRPDEDELVMDTYDNRTYAETDLLRYRNYGPPGWKYELRESVK